MPLPKSASISARATEVYSETCPLVLKLISEPPTADLEENTSFKDVMSYLPFLRQLVTCCACAGIAEESMISLSCGHCYCYECQHREPLLKIQCRQCRERKGLVCESQLRAVVQLYKEMVTLLSIHFKEVSIIKETSFNEIIQEVVSNQKVSRSVLMIPPPPEYQLVPKQVTIITPKKSIPKNQSLSEAKTATARKPGKTRKKLMVDEKQTLPPKEQESPGMSKDLLIPESTDTLSKASCSSDTVCLTSSMTSTSSVTSTSKSAKKSHKQILMTKLQSRKQQRLSSPFCCRCGTNPLNKANNSDRICARRKCPCYINQHACKKCKCKGCHNPYN